VLEYTHKKDPSYRGSCEERARATAGSCTRLDFVQGPGVKLICAAPKSKLRSVQSGAALYPTVCSSRSITGKCDLQRNRSCPDWAV